MEMEALWRKQRFTIFMKRKGKARGMIIYAALLPILFRWLKVESEV